MPSKEFIQRLCIVVILSSVGGLSSSTLNFQPAKTI